MGNNRYNKMKVRISSTVFCGILLFLSACSEMDVDSNVDMKVVNQSNVEHEELLKVHFIDVGQGDSVLIQHGQEAMLIDAGGNEYGEIVVEYIKEQDIDSLKYAIGTHPHEDHVGGLDDVIKNIDVDTVILPDYTLSTKTYTSVLEAMKEENVNSVLPRVGDVYSLGDSRFTIISPVKKDYGNNANNYSVGIKLEYMNTSFVSLGDAEIEAEKDILMEGFDLEADLYKVSHHGSDTSNSYEFMEVVDPIYGVISVGTGNSYGHPSNKVVTDLLEGDIMVYRTDKNGTVVATSDGKDFVLTVEKKIGTGSSSNEITKNSKEKDKANQKDEQTQLDIVKKSSENKNNIEKILFYRTKTGSKYHVESCTHLKSSKILVTEKEWEDKKYSPCDVCIIQ